MIFYVFFPLFILYSSKYTLINSIIFVLSFLVPEDNVERLRNIRDMFENTDTQVDEELQLQKVEKQQPSDKIKNIFLK